MNTITDNIFYRFGVRGLIAKVFKNLLISMLFFGIFIFLLFAKNSEVFTWLDGTFGVSVGGGLTVVSGAVAVLSVIVQIIVSWISYMTTSFMISDSSISLRSGFLTRREDSFPLRHINNVSHHQGIVDQIFGVGTCIIEMSSDEADAPHADDVVMNDLDQGMVRVLSEMLLNRANTQRMTVASPLR